MADLRKRLIRLAYENPELRVPLKPLLEDLADKTAADVDTHGMAAEVITTRVQGQKVEDAIDTFIQSLIRDGQELNGIVEQAIRRVDGYFPGEKVNRRILLKEIGKVIERRWGRDEMHELLARLVLGEFIY